MGTGEVMSDQGEWVRVESEDELRLGMVVKKTPCAWCGREEVQIIIEEMPATGYAINRNGTRRRTVSRRSFMLANQCHLPGVFVALDLAIREGRLFRLAVPPDEAAIADEKMSDFRAKYPVAGDLLAREWTR